MPALLRMSNAFLVSAVSSPNTVTFPSVGRRRALMSLASVDLPLPFLPSTATNSPSAMVRETPLTANSPPSSSSYEYFTFSKQTAGRGAAGASVPSCGRVSAGAFASCSVSIGTHYSKTAKNWQRVFPRFRPICGPHIKFNKISAFGLTIVLKNIIIMAEPWRAACRR